MKKLLSIVAVLLVCMGAQAQIVSSRSSIVRVEKAEKQPSRTQWFMRVGMNFMNMTGEGAEDLKSKMGYDVKFGFAKTMGSAGAYWGMDFGLTSRGFKYEDDYYDEDEKYTAHAVQISPFTFGWKINVIDKLSIDPHVGAFLSCDYASIVKSDDLDNYDWSDFADDAECDYNRFDAGINVGVGVWYSRFNLDFSYQHGFVNVFTDMDGFKSGNFMINLGVAF